MTKDYYQTLGIGKDASKEDIKKAYKKLAKTYHPDINKESNATEKFKEVSEAYAVLSDDTKRSNYDRFGSTDEQFSGFQGGFNEDMFSDIFNEFFGGNPFGGRSKKRRGADLKYELEITFLEAAFGTKKKIEVTKLDPCEKCDGSGAKNKEMKTCGTCQGSGQVAQQFRTPFGIVRQATVCKQCSGQGEQAKDPCTHCKGEGRKNNTKTITVTIPAGVDNGSTLRIVDEGEAGVQGAPQGHLYVELYVEPHNIFEREKNTIHLEYPITFAQAALGDEVKVPTLEGDITMKIPAGTESHTIFRLKGKGIPYLNGYGKGDQMVRIILKTPKSLSLKQKELFESLAEENKEKLKIEKGFFEKVKDAFTS